MRMLVVPWLMCAACISGKDYDWNLGAIDATSGLVLDLGSKYLDGC
jgi:hypothetical protein